MPGLRRLPGWPSNTPCWSRCASDPRTGIELTRRFDRSIGFFWQATHQQIYKVLRRMESDGWVTAAAGDARSTERKYAVTQTGERVLADWIGSPTAPRR